MTECRDSKGRLLWLRRCLLVPALVIMAGLALLLLLRPDEERKPSYLFNDKGLLIRKESRAEIVELSYDDRFAKISRMARTRPGNGNTPPEISTYRYNDQGNLVEATDPAGEEVVLEYDAQGHITSIDQVGNSTLEITYNDLELPATISLRGGDSAVFTYDGQGTITEVGSKDGPDTAIKLSRTYQKLLSIVKAAEINLER